MSHIESMAAAHQRHEDEAAALDAHEAAEAERKRINLMAAIKHGGLLGDPMYVTLLDLVQDFAGDSGLTGQFAKRGAAADHFLETAVKAIAAQAEAGDQDAQVALGNLENFFVRNGQ